MLWWNINQNVYMLETITMVKLKKTYVTRKYVNTKFGVN